MRHFASISLVLSSNIGDYIQGFEPGTNKWLAAVLTREPLKQVKHLIIFTKTKLYA
jgi:hypothetical protein